MLFIRALSAYLLYLIIIGIMGFWHILRPNARRDCPACGEFAYASGECDYCGHRRRGLKSGNKGDLA